MQGAMYKGTHTQTVDAKGRMVFPSKLRELLGDSFTLTKGVGGCIFVYSLEAFAEKAEKLNSLPMATALTLQRSFMANATDVEADKQGRILIPARLRELAGLENEAAVIGVSDHCEIWNPERWNELNDSVSDEDFMKALEGSNF
ncbi:MAG: division/cell wall cluster transcriptional repressor MraZ [Ruminococcus sp.]|nr:division/cell wall cluster transcriptional repressor MraZ [Ruminococcus sp.]